jgi:hypothetical protein
MIKIIVTRKIIDKIEIIVTIIRTVKMSIILMMIRVTNEIIKKKDQINNLMIVKKEKKYQVKNENIINLNLLMKKYNKQTYLHENLVEQKPIQITIIKLTIIIVAKTKTHQNIKRSLKSQML